MTEFWDVFEDVIFIAWISIWLNQSKITNCMQITTMNSESILLPADQYNL